MKYKKITKICSLCIVLSGVLTVFAFVSPTFGESEKNQSIEENVQQDLEAAEYSQEEFATLVSVYENSKEAIMNEYDMSEAGYEEGKQALNWELNMKQQSAEYKISKNQDKSDEVEEATIQSIHAYNRMLTES